MNRNTAVFAFFGLGVVLAAALVFASIEFRRMSTAFGALDDRVARLESGGAPRGDAPAPGEASQPDRRAPAGATGEVASELAKIREEIAALRGSSGDHSSGTGGTPGGPAVASTGGSGFNEEDLS
jgi:hypothetical protein